MASKFELNDTTPAAPGGKVNVKWQSDVNGNVSAYVDPPGAGGFGDPTTTKGDLIARGSSSPATRLGVGIDGQVLTVDSAQTLGVKWATPSGGGSSPLTTKGDLFGFSSVAARIPIGTDNQVLIADSTQALGLRWGAPSPWTADQNAANFKLFGAGKVIIGSSADVLGVLQVTGDSYFAGKILFSPDNTYDIGASGANRPKNIYLAGTLNVAAGITGGGQYATSASMSCVSGYIKTDAAGDVVYVSHAGGTVNGKYGLYWDKTNEQLEVQTGGLMRWAFKSDGSFASDSALVRPTHLFDQGATARARIQQAAAAPRLDFVANGYFDGSSWQRDDISQTTVLISEQASASGAAVNIGYAPAGANPALIQNRFQFDALNVVFNVGMGGSRPTILFDQGATARGRIFQTGATHQVTLSANCYYDGANWQRDDTSKPSVAVQLLGGSSPTLYAMYYSAAGSGAIGATFPNTPFTFDLANSIMQVAGAAAATPSVRNDRTGSRAINTTYQNTTGKPIFVHINLNVSATSGAILYIDSASTPSLLGAQVFNGYTSAQGFTLNGWIPVNWYYKVNAGTLSTWIEWT